MDHYPDRLDASVSQAMARDRARSSPSGIGACVVQQRAGADGQRWSVLVSDGQTEHDLDVVAPDAPPHQGIDPLVVAEAVEREAAGEAPAADRLRHLIERGRITLGPGEL